MTAGFALDSNILIYGEIEPESAKGMRRVDLILPMRGNGVMPRKSSRRISSLRPASLPGLEDAVRQALRISSCSSRHHD